jgi:hypothetical protein
VDQIVAKVWLIGRAYAAAIERRKERTLFSGDAFYIDHVGPKIKASGIDGWLSRLEGLHSPTAESLPDILRCHARLTKLFRTLRNSINDRSHRNTCIFTALHSSLSTTPGQMPRCGDSGFR